MNRGAGVGLGDDQQMRLARLGPSLRIEPPEAPGVGLVVAQETQAGAGDGVQHILLALTIQGVLAIAQEGEVLIGQPQQQAPGVGDLFRVDRWRVGLETCRDLTTLERHLGPVLDRLTHVRKDTAEALRDLLQRSLVDLAVDLDVHPRLEPCAELVIGDRIDVQDLLQRTCRVATNDELRVDDQMERTFLA